MTFLGRLLYGIIEILYEDFIWIHVYFIYIIIKMSNLMDNNITKNHEENTTFVK
jgi:hypothetical protein